GELPPIPPKEAASSDVPERGSTTSRRTFLLWTAGAAVIGVVGIVAGTAFRAGTRAVQSVREALRLPAPATPAPA
ncbi:hypothetical protein ACSTI4_24380, partial [Vibrio parahaemolyticus]